MVNKILIYIGGGLIVLILMIGLFNLGKISGSSVKEINDNLEEYRSEKIPEACRLPSYEKNVKSWKEHLSHHQNTLYCLDYY